MKKEVTDTAEKKDDDAEATLGVMNSAKLEARDQVHDLEYADCHESTYQSGLQKYSETFKPKISVASSTFSQ